MLRALFSVLEQEVNNPQPIFILAPTAVVHTYCRMHGDCNENEAVKDYVSFLEENILDQLQTDLAVRKNREKVCNFMYFIYYQLSAF